jgi:hypothetical protein
VAKAKQDKLHIKNNCLWKTIHVSLFITQKSTAQNACTREHADSITKNINPQVYRCVLSLLNYNSSQNDLKSITLSSFNSFSPALKDKFAEQNISLFLSAWNSGKIHEKESQNSSRTFFRCWSFYSFVHQLEWNDVLPSISIENGNEDRRFGRTSNAPGSHVLMSWAPTKGDVWTWAKTDEVHFGLLSGWRWHQRGNRSTSGGLFSVKIRTMDRRIMKFVFATGIRGQQLAVLPRASYTCSLLSRLWFTLYTVRVFCSDIASCPCPVSREYSHPYKLLCQGQTVFKNSICQGRMCHYIILKIINKCKCTVIVVTTWMQSAWYNLFAVFLTWKALNLNCL